MVRCLHSGRTSTHGPVPVLAKLLQRAAQLSVTSKRCEGLSSSHVHPFHARMIGHCFARLASGFSMPPGRNQLHSAAHCASSWSVTPIVTADKKTCAVDCHWHAGSDRALADLSSSLPLTSCNVQERRFLNPHVVYGICREAASFGRRMLVLDGDAGTPYAPPVAEEHFHSSLVYSLTAFTSSLEAFVEDYADAQQPRRTGNVFVTKKHKKRQKKKLDTLEKGHKYENTKITHRPFISSNINKNESKTLTSQHDNNDDDNQNPNIFCLPFYGASAAEAMYLSLACRWLGQAMRGIFNSSQQLQLRRYLSDWLAYLPATFWSVCDYALGPFFFGCLARTLVLWGVYFPVSSITRGVFTAVMRSLTSFLSLPHSRDSFDVYAQQRMNDDVTAANASAALRHKRRLTFVSALLLQRYLPLCMLLKEPDARYVRMLQSNILRCSCASINRCEKSVLMIESQPPRLHKVRRIWTIQRLRVSMNNWMRWHHRHCFLAHLHRHGSRELLIVPPCPPPVSFCADLSGATATAPTMGDSTQPLQSHAFQFYFFVSLPVSSFVLPGTADRLAEYLVTTLTRLFTEDRQRAELKESLSYRLLWCRAVVRVVNDIDALCCFLVGLSHIGIRMYYQLAMLSHRCFHRWHLPLEGDGINIDVSVLTTPFRNAVAVDLADLPLCLHRPHSPVQKKKIKEPLKPRF